MFVRSGFKASRAPSRRDISSLRLEKIDSYHVGPFAGRRLQKKKPDGSLTQDRHHFSSFHLCRFKSAETCIQGFEKAGFLEGNLVGYPDGPIIDNPVHDSDVLGESAAGGLKARGCSRTPVKLALRIEPLPAVEASAARDVVMDRNTISGNELRYSSPDGNHGSRGLVSEDPWRLNQAVFNLLDVGAAHSTSLDPHQKLSVTDLRYRHSLERQLILSAVDGRAHVSGNGEALFLVFENCGVHSFHKTS